MRLDLLRELNAARAARRPVAVVTALGTGEQRIVTDVEADPLGPAIAKAMLSGKSATVADPAGGEAFVEVHAPPLRLVVIGAVHVSQAMAPMAAALGYDVTIVDPRTAFATPERFPGVALLAEWPDIVLPTLRLDRYTALAALTHDPKIDDPALVAALAAGCFYVGALGSRKTHASRRERLLAAGLAEEAFGRIRAPIGLPIGASSPAEIAVAILAEITAAARRPEYLA